MSMLRAIGVVLIVAVSSVISPAPAQTWIEYRPEGAGYSIELPGEWKPSTEEVKTEIGVLKARRATVTLGRRVFITSYIVYPDDAIRGVPVGVMLDGTRNVMVASMKGTLRKGEQLTVSDLPARELIIDAPNNLVVVARYFLLRNTIVQAIMAGWPGAENEADTRYFLDSLKVASP